MHNNICLKASWPRNLIGNLKKTIAATLYNQTSISAANRLDNILAAKIKPFLNVSLLTWTVSSSDKAVLGIYKLKLNSFPHVSW